MLPFVILIRYHLPVSELRQEPATPVSEDPGSSVSRDGFTKLSLMHQTAREAAEAVSNDPHPSAGLDAFEKALSASLKELVLRSEAALCKGEWRNFTSFATSACLWAYESILCRMSKVATLSCRGRCLFISVQWAHHHPVRPRY
jgi:hypothetical protein